MKKTKFDANRDMAQVQIEQLLAEMQELRNLVVSRDSQIGELCSPREAG